MRKMVSGKQNIWSNAQSVDDLDLKTEQDYNNLIQSGIISNHFGNGVVSDQLSQKTLFDSSKVIGLLDGKALDPQLQVSDNNFGNQLEFILSDSAAAGKRSVKVFVIGLDFENNLQYETFTFFKNESQFGKKHFTKLLKIYINDILGDSAQSLNLGGILAIKESKNLILSRDCIAVAQDIQPNIFFRDFFVSDAITLNVSLVNALPSYNTDNLNITSSYKQLRGLIENDVSSQIGQKFQANTNNIQKITLLMSTTNSANPLDLQWNGDLIISLYQLQSSLDCPYDIAPGTAIAFDPSNIPLAQLSFNYNSFADRGIVLTEVPQPVDFIFSNTAVGLGNLVKSGSYYAITAKRSGSADKCTLQFATGDNVLDNSVITFFNGSIWVDVSDEDMWFQVWTDSAKISDGQFYDDGHGAVVEKTKINHSTGATEDYCLSPIIFNRNDVYYGVASAVIEKSEIVQDQRTGDPILSRQEFVPSVSLLTASQLTSLENSSSPLILGTVADKNVKISFAGNPPTTSSLKHFSVIKNQILLKVIDDPTDPRYDLSIMNLVSELSGGGGVTNTNSLLNGKFIFNTSNPSRFYRIADTELISLIYGDLNNDGVVNDDDLIEAQSLLSQSIVSAPTKDEYITLITPFKDDASLTWQLYDPILLTVVDSGTDGIIVSDPTDPSKAVFTSASATFLSVPSIGDKQLIISGVISNLGNNGTFSINGVIDDFSINMFKTYYTSDSILKIFQADIDGYMSVDSGDISSISNYVNKVPPFPSVSSPSNRVGTRFNVIRLTFEPYVDRADDYSTSMLSRASLIHITPDIMLDGYTDGFSVFGTNLLTSPVSFSISKQLEWKDYLVNSSSNPKLSFTSFNYQSGSVVNDCNLEASVYSKYPIDLEFDRGKNDLFMPSNLIINDGGELLRPDGYHYKVDIEMNTFILDIPQEFMAEEKQLNIFTDLVADYSGDGRTRIGTPCMKFADCSDVKLDALTKNQVRFDVSVQSLSMQLSGEDVDGYTGIIVDGRVGVYLDDLSGLLTLNFANVFEDPILKTRKTRIQIIAYVKKSGFNNKTLVLDSTKVKNLLEI